MASFQLFIDCLLQVSGWLLVLIFAAMTSVMAGMFFSSLIRTIKKTTPETKSMPKFLLFILAILALLNLIPVIELVKAGWNAWDITFFAIEALGALIGIISGCLHNGHDFEFDR